MMKMGLSLTSDLRDLPVALPMAKIRPGFQRVERESRPNKKCSFSVFRVEAQS